MLSDTESKDAERLIIFESVDNNCSDPGKLLEKRLNLKNSIAKRVINKTKYNFFILTPEITGLYYYLPFALFYITNFAALFSILKLLF